jgi:serine/threonine-protein kinase
VLHVIGQGGFGITYKGILFTEVMGPLGAITTEVPVSIKEYFFKESCYRNPDDYSVKVHPPSRQLLFDKFKEKLLKEARILSDVRHPHIVNVLDVFEENNTAYITMEYISGNSLKQKLERGGVLPEKKMLKYIHQVGTALRFVHEKNILHLDIKPSNILIDKFDNARLIDFGVSKRYDMENRETSTTIPTLSKGFASIEQYDNEGMQNFSPCPDVYSLGATMYYLLTGILPTESILRATRPLMNPSIVNPSISSKTESVILKAMQVNPADRFQTITEMMEALDVPPIEHPSGSKGIKDTEKKEAPPQRNEEAALQEAPATPPQPEEEPASQRTRIKKKSVFVASLTGIVIVAVAVFLLDYNKATPNPIELPPVSPIEEEIETQPVEHNVTAPSVSKEAAPERRKKDVQAAENKIVIETNPKTAIAPPPVVADEKAEYAALIASGKAKMQAGNYAGADADFKKAAKKEPSTDEVKRLISANASAIEAQQIAERMALYEVKGAFGNFQIVRNKSTGKYGAVDEKGNEHIVCKYIHADISEEGGAFEREDKMFDIYNMDGELVRSDITY